MSNEVDKSQSFRLACDRCRAHKLRCPQNQTSVASGACQRCLRAKTQCTFSPRARAGKVSKSTILAPGEAGLQTYRKPRLPGPVTTTSAAKALSGLNEQPSSISELSQGSPTDFLDPERTGYGSPIVQTISTKLAGRGFEGFAFDIDTTTEFADGASMGRVSFADQFADTIKEGMLVETSVEAYSSMGDYAREINDSIYTSERAQTSTASSSDRHGSFERSSAPPLSIENHDGKWTQKLSTLAVAFHQQLEKLIHGPWAESPLQSGHSMGSYPIGDILQLSQELISISLSISWEADRKTIDVTTALPVLNCYLSLIKTYSVVFAHLSKYLRAVASLRLPDYIFHPPPGMLFEELQPSSEAFNRTHAASQMLLGTLARIENILDIPGEYRCTIASGEPATFDRAISTPTSDMTFSDEKCSNADTETHNSSDQSTAPSGILVGDELLQAVLRGEAMNGDGGAIILLRKRVDAVKMALRQELALDPVGWCE